jgi:hypothetical protein
MVRGLVLALCVVACAAYRPSSVSLLEVAVAGPAAAGSESEGGSGSVVSSESEGGSQKPTGATGATGATGGAKQAFAAQKGKPLIKVCIKEKGLSSEDAENQADTQETVINKIFAEIIAGAEIEFEEVVAFDPLKDNLADVCGVDTPPGGATGTSGSEASSGSESEGAGSEGSEGAGSVAPTTDPKAAAGPAAGSEGAAASPTIAGDVGIKPGAIASFAAGADIKVFKAPRHLEHVAGALEPSFLEERLTARLRSSLAKRGMAMGPTGGATGGATGATGATGAKGPAPLLLIRANIQFDENKATCKEGGVCGEDYVKKLLAFFGDSAKTNAILDQAGFRVEGRDVTMELATQPELDRVEEKKKKKVPVVKIPQKKKSAGTRTSTGVGAAMLALAVGAALVCRPQ